jgi:hypothetical protein
LCLIRDLVYLAFTVIEFNPGVFNPAEETVGNFNELWTFVWKNNQECTRCCFLADLVADFFFFQTRKTQNWILLVVLCHHVLGHFSHSTIPSGTKRQSITFFCFLLVNKTSCTPADLVWKTCKIYFWSR